MSAPLAYGGPEARRLFVDREEIIKEFVSRLHAFIPGSRPSDVSTDVLIVYGEGGIGKTQLLHHLQDHYCRILTAQKDQLLHPWVNLSQLEGRRLVDALRFAPPPQPSEAQNELSADTPAPRACRLVPNCLIDFAADTQLGENSRDAMDGMLMIRRRLQIPSPLFMAACILYLDADKRLTREWIEQWFPGVFADLAVSIVDQPLAASVIDSLQAAIHAASSAHLAIAAGAAAAGPALLYGMLLKGIWGAAAPKGAPALARWLSGKQLSKYSVDGLRAMKPGELIQLLPELFASDLNRYVEFGHHPVVLFFDAYDRLIGSRTGVSSRERDARHEWFRQLLSHLHVADGTIVVITAQEPPSLGPHVSVRCFPLECISSQDALFFLRNAGVESAELREAMARLAEVRPGQVQPMLAALLADAHRLRDDRDLSLDAVHLGDNISVLEKQQEIVDRLLGAADDELRFAITALSVTRAFDWNLFRELGGKLGFAHTRPFFETLTGLSCVRRASKGQFRIHELIRRFLHGSDYERDVHVACREYYLHSDASPVDAVFHEYFLDQNAAATSWIVMFSKAAAARRHDQCSALLVIRYELGSSFGIEFGDAVGRYLTSVGRYSEANGELSNAVAFWARQTGSYPDSANAHGNKASAFLGWADLHSCKGDFEKGDEAFSSAVAEFDRALMLAPNNIANLSDMGIALQDWAELRAKRGNLEEADKKYGKAVKACDRALALDPNYMHAHTNKGNAFLRWAAQRQLLGDREGAEDKYRACLTAYNQALALDPKSLNVLNNRGLAYAGWADLCNRMADYTGADEEYAAAVGAYNTALTLSPNFGEAHNNRAIALLAWANLHRTLGDHQKRRRSTARR